MWEKLVADFYQNFIEDNRWKYITDGLQNTLKITFFAVLIGIVLGFLVAIIRSTYENTHRLKIVVFVTVNPGMVPTAILAFGINSGAYVAEIFRSGISSIERGQFEAGRSLGFNYAQTMWYIIMPQAFKNVVPTLANEFIVLLKETSVAGYIGLQDLTKGGDIIKSRTYSAFMPLIAVALIYLCMVMIFSYLVKLLERRLRRSEH